MHSLEPFLLMLSSVFVPLYGVILARLAGQADVVALVTQRRISYSAVGIWLLGIACYYVCAQLGLRTAHAGTDFRARQGHPPKPFAPWSSGMSRIDWGA